MKNFRLFCSFLAVATLAIGMTASAQTRTKNVSTVNQGYTVEFGGAGYVPSDSLQVSDSIGYFIPVNHTNSVDPFIQFAWTKIGAGTATLGVNFYQSSDNITYLPVLKGAAQSAYTKSYTLSATTPATQISFLNDTARFEGRYMKIIFFTTSTASVKGKIDVLLKPSIH